MIDLTKLPPPLVPEGTDLQGYEFMPLFGEALRVSSFNRRATDAEFRAAVNLWWSAWWEIPAASLPNNELDIALAAGCKTIRQWRKVREWVMSKWVLCSDDRWYHPYLAPHAINAFAKRKSASSKGALGAQKMWENKRNGQAPARSAGELLNGPGRSWADTPAFDKRSPGNGKLSEVNTPLPPTRNSTPTTPAMPKAAAHSVARTEQVKREAREAEKRKADPPGGSVKDFVKQVLKKPETPPKAEQPAELEPDPSTTTALEEAPEQPIAREAPKPTLPRDWASTPDGIELAAKTLDMVRLPFEQDEDFVDRIVAVISLQQPKAMP